MATIYGIPNCERVRRARRWLEDQGVDYRFRDVKKTALDAKTLRHWVNQVGWEHLINRHSTTWRQLPEMARNNLDAERAIKLMQAYPTVIRQPVLVREGQVQVGFDASAYAGLLQTA